jgi:hypothetical protein
MVLPPILHFYTLGRVVGYNGIMLRRGDKDFLLRPTLHCPFEPIDSTPLQTRISPPRQSVVSIILETIHANNTRMKPEKGIKAERIKKAE